MVLTVSAQDGYRIPHEQFELSNGLRVVLHRDTSLPVVAVNVAYKAGSSMEERGKSGVANIAGAMLLQSSRNIPRETLLSIMDQCGGSFGGSVDVDRMDFWSLFPAHCLETALWIESDRMGFGADAFSKGRFDTIRAAVLRDAERIEKNPVTLAKQILYGKLYPASHAYSWPTPGKKEEVKKIRLADVRTFTTQFVQPGNASICIGGNFDPSVARSLVRKYFESLPSSNVMTEIGNPVDYSRFRSQAIVVEEQVDRSRLLIAFHAPAFGASQSAPLQAVAHLLAAGRSGRLWRELVFSRKLALEVEAYQSSQRAAGLFWIVVTCKPETKLGIVYNTVMQELEKLAKGEIDEFELISMTNSLAVEFLLPLEKLGGLGGRVDALNLSNLYTGNPLTFLESYWLLPHLNLATITSVVSEFLNADRATVLSIVPHGKAELGVTNP